MTETSRIKLPDRLVHTALYVVQYLFQQDNLTDFSNVQMDKDLFLKMFKNAISEQKPVDKTIEQLKELYITKATEINIPEELIIGISGIFNEKADEVLKPEANLMSQSFGLDSGPETTDLIEILGNQEEGIDKAFDLE